MIETALTMILFFLLIFSVFVAGRLFQVQEVITNAAREGARFAVAPLSNTSTLPTDDEIVARVNLFLDSASISGATITINGKTDGTGMEDPEEDADGVDFTRVEVSVPFNFISLPLLGELDVTLTGEALMRNETSNETG